MSEPILISACLLGLKTRYDGTGKANPAVFDYLKANGGRPIPVCPEQLGGLPTPRPAAKIACGQGQAVMQGSARVLTENGEDVTQAFRHGARMVADIAQLTGCRRAVLKERSPSCGVHRIYRGENVVPGDGVTAALLRMEGLSLLSEEDLADD